MSQDKERFFTMAQMYDKLSHYFVPQYDFLQQEAINITNFDVNDGLLIADLGAGSGIFLEKILRKYKNAECVYIDYSDDFQKVAEKRLADYSDRVVFAKASFNDNWEEQLPGKLDAVFSMSAIHHLNNDNKYCLYKRCYEVLKDGGWFINTDEMKTIYDDAYKMSLIKWWRFYLEEKEKLPENLRIYEKEWHDKFSNWKSRNIDGYSHKKTEGDDMHESFLDQVNWLKEIGFSYADVFVKYHLWSVIGGKKGG